MNASQYQYQYQYGDWIFFPSYLANLLAWYRFNIGIMVSGSGVSIWSDQSSNGNDLLQTSDTNRPMFESDGTILFDGVDNFLVTSPFTLNQPFTFYALMKQVTWTVNEHLWSGVSGVASVIQLLASPTIASFAGAGAAGNNNLVLNTYLPIAVVFDGANSSVKVGSTPKTTGNPGANNPGGITLGASAAATGFSNVQYKEVAVYSGAHSDAETTKIFNYFSQVGKGII